MRGSDERERERACEQKVPRWRHDFPHSSQHDTGASAPPVRSGPSFVTSPQALEHISPRRLAPRDTCCHPPLTV